MKLILSAICTSTMFLLGCVHKESVPVLFKRERFSILLPATCSYKKPKNGIDSEYGEIECKEFKISYDYGYCNYSDYSVYSKKDYLRRNQWLLEAMSKVFPKGKEISIDTIFKKIKVLSVDENLLIGKFEYKGGIFEHHIEIPPHLINLKEKSDTLSGVITRIIYDPGSMKKIDCYKINTLRHSPDLSCYESLIIWMTSNTSIDSIMAFNIFNSIKFH